MKWSNSLTVVRPHVSTCAVETGWAGGVLTWMWGCCSWGCALHPFPFFFSFYCNCDNACLKTEHQPKQEQSFVTVALKLDSQLFHVLFKQTLTSMIHSYHHPTLKCFPLFISLPPSIFSPNRLHFWWLFYFNSLPSLYFSFITTGQACSQQWKGQRWMLWMWLQFNTLRLNQFAKCCDIHTVHTSALFCITSLHFKTFDSCIKTNTRINPPHAPKPVQLSLCLSSPLLHGFLCSSQTPFSTWTKPNTSSSITRAAFSRCGCFTTAGCYCPGRSSSRWRGSWPTPRSPCQGRRSWPRSPQGTGRWRGRASRSQRHKH